MPLLAIEGGDGAARRAALALARRWIADHGSVPESLWAPVLRTAVRADSTVGAALLARVGHETDRVAQRAIYQALALTPDPALHAQVLQRLLAADPIPPEMVQLLAVPPVDIERQVARAGFVAANASDLIRRMPEDYEKALLVTACDAGSRESLDRLYRDLLVDLPDVGPIAVAQALESMDQCIARRAIQGPALDAALR